jgi:hypothetical protein
MDVDEDHQGKSSNENAVAGKKRKLEEVEGSIAPVTPKEDSTANRSLSNGFAEDKTNEDSNIKPSKRQKKSSEVCSFLSLTIGPYGFFVRTSFPVV